MSFMSRCETWFQFTVRNMIAIRFYAIIGALFILTFTQFFILCGVLYFHWHGQEGRQLDILGKALWFNQAMIFVGLGALWQQRINFRGFGAELNTGDDRDRERDNGTS